MKKVLFIVPHEDDELFVGGGMLVNLAMDPSYEPFVLIATNGDYFPKESKTRIRESLAALKVLGIGKANVIFGGYGDEWQGEHIYHSKDNEPKISYAGHTETYLGLSDIDEWHFGQYGAHNAYTRVNYLNELVDILLSIKPEVVVCVDMDSHADHKALSLICDEAIKQIIISSSDYTPLYLKKFAYNGAFYGRDDFYDANYTKTIIDDDFSTKFFNNDNALRYEVHPACKTKRLMDNILFKAAKRYKSQEVWLNAGRFINGDITYWQRSTNNLALRANISVSSGEAKWLNDFKLLDTADVRNKKDSFRDLCWKPDENEKESTIIISLEVQEEVSLLNIYYDIDKPVNKVKIQFYDTGEQLKNEMSTAFDCLGGECKKICLAESMLVKTIKIHITPNVNSFIGINEIEILKHEQEIPFREYICQKHESEKGKESDYNRLDKVMFDVLRYTRNHYNVVRKWLSEKR